MDKYCTANVTVLYYTETRWADTTTRPSREVGLGDILDGTDMAGKGCRTDNVTVDYGDLLPFHQDVR